MKKFGGEEIGNKNKKLIEVNPKNEKRAKMTFIYDLKVP